MRCHKVIKVGILSFCQPHIDIGKRSAQGFHVLPTWHPSPDLPIYHRILGNPDLRG